MQGTQVATRQSLVEKFAQKYSIEGAKLMGILKATAFKVTQGEATNEQMAALLVVADQYGLNPFTREIFAFEDKRKGIVPVVSVDGWARIVNDHPHFNGCEFEYGPETATPDGRGKKAFEWVECVMYHKQREHPIRVREYLDEVYQGPRNNYDGPWQSHTKRMQRHKTFIQTARLAFGFSGIYDEDEAQRIVDAGGGVAVPIDSGGTAVEGEVQTASRTAGLAADLQQRAAQAEDAQLAGGAAEALKPMSAETIRKTIRDSEDADEVNGLLQHILAQPAGDEKKQLMKAWNERMLKFKGGSAAAEPAQQQTAPAASSDTVPAAFAGKPADEKPAAKKSTAKPPAEKPADPPAPKQAEQAPPAGFASSPVPEGKPTEDHTLAVINEMTNAKTLDDLYLIADRENKRLWSQDQRKRIFDTFSARRTELDG